MNNNLITLYSSGYTLVAVSYVDNTYDLNVCFHCLACFFKCLYLKENNSSLTL